MPSEGIEGDEWAAYLALSRMAGAPVLSPGRRPTRTRRAHHPRQPRRDRAALNRAAESEARETARSRTDQDLLDGKVSLVQYLGDIATYIFSRLSL